MNFSFRLDKVLRHRQRLVDARARDLAKAETVLAMACRDLAAIATEIATLHDEAVRQRTVRVDPHRQAHEQQWLQWLQQRRDRQADVVAAAETTVSEAHARLVAAHREQKVLENLRERQYQQWLLDQSRTERKFLDEVAGVRADRQRRQRTPRAGA